MLKSSRNWLYYAVGAGVVLLAVVLLAIGSQTSAKADRAGSIRYFYQQAHDLGIGAGGVVYQTDDTDSGGESEPPQDPEPAPEEDQTE